MCTQGKQGHGSGVQPRKDKRATISRCEPSTQIYKNAAKWHNCNMCSHNQLQSLWAEVSGAMCSGNRSPSGASSPLAVTNVHCATL